MEPCPRCSRDTGRYRWHSLRLEAATMAGTVTQLLVVACTLQVVLRANDQTVKVTVELVRRHEEQRSQEMAFLLQMEQGNQHLHKMAQENPLLSACQHCWFWAAAEILLVLFGFYWLPRHDGSGHDGSGHDGSGHDSCGYNSSAVGETPAEPRRKRRRRRRKRMHRIADYGDKLDLSSPDLCLERKDMQNSKEEMEGTINAFDKPFPQETFGQSCIQGIR